MKPGDTKTKKLSGGAKRQWLRERYDEIKAYVDRHGINAACGAYDTSPETLKRLLATDHGEYGHVDHPGLDMVSLRHQMNQVHYDMEKYSMWAASVNEDRREEIRAIKELTRRVNIMINIATEQSESFGAALGRVVAAMIAGAGYQEQAKQLEKGKNDIIGISGKILGTLDSGLGSLVLSSLDDITYNLGTKRVGERLTEEENEDDTESDLDESPAAGLGGQQPGILVSNDHRGEVPR